jgi:RNase P subunit RPR2
VGGGNHKCLPEFRLVVSSLLVKMAGPTKRIRRKIMNAEDIAKETVIRIPMKISI